MCYSKAVTIYITCKQYSSVQCKSSPDSICRIVSVKMAAREYINIFHILQSFLHVVQVGLGYLLMLVAMSYNGYLFLAVVFGAGFGYFIFAVFRKKSSPTAKTFEEDNEHCST